MLHLGCVGVTNLVRQEACEVICNWPFESSWVKVKRYVGVGTWVGVGKRGDERRWSWEGDLDGGRGKERVGVARSVGEAWRVGIIRRRQQGKWAWLGGVLKQVIKSWVKGHRRT